MTELRKSDSQPRAMRRPNGSYVVVRDSPIGEGIVELYEVPSWVGEAIVSHGKWARKIEAMTDGELRELVKR